MITLIYDIAMARFRIYTQEEKKKKKDQLLRAPSVGKHNSTRVDEGKERAEIFFSR